MGCKYMESATHATLKDKWTGRELARRFDTFPHSHRRPSPQTPPPLPPCPQSVADILALQNVRTSTPGCDTRCKHNMKMSGLRKVEMSGLTIFAVFQADAISGLFDESAGARSRGNNSTDCPAIRKPISIWSRTSGGGRRSAMNASAAFFTRLTSRSFSDISMGQEHKKSNGERTIANAHHATVGHYSVMGRRD